MWYHGEHRSCNALVIHYDGKGVNEESEITQKYVANTVRTFSHKSLNCLDCATKKDLRLLLLKFCIYHIDFI